MNIEKVSDLAPGQGGWVYHANFAVLKKGLRETVLVRLSACVFSEGSAGIPGSPWVWIHRRSSGIGYIASGRWPATVITRVTDSEEHWSGVAFMKTGCSCLAPQLPVKAAKPLPYSYDEAREAWVRDGNLMDLFAMIDFVSPEYPVRQADGTWGTAQPPAAQPRPAAPVKQSRSPVQWPVAWFAIFGGISLALTASYGQSSPGWVLPATICTLVMSIIMLVTALLGWADRRRG
jgi:hypothetical protein